MTCWRLILASWAFLPYGAAVAHPVSHTDAWVKVGDRVQVRLNVFLDDVLLHQGCLTPEIKSIATAKVQKAIRDHSDTLLRQLRVFDRRGIPLVGEVVKVPSWRTEEAGVDLVADASLKLTWDLIYSFESVNDAMGSLVFVHDFTHESLQQPGELRLHLQVKSNGKRIDAVIPPATPHTVVFPSGTDAENVQVVTDANSATSRVLIGPAHVTHEFTAPLLLMDSAWSDAKEFSLSSGGSLTDDRSVQTAIDTSEVAKIKQQLTDWFLDNTTVSIDGSKLVPSSVTVQFLPAAMAPGATAEEYVSESNHLPMFGTLVGIRVVHPRGRSLKEIELTWVKSPGAFYEAMIYVVTARESVSQLVSVLTSTRFGENVLDFHWSAPSSGIGKVAGVIRSERDGHSISAVLRTVGYPLVARIMAGLLLCFILCLVVTLFRKNVSLLSLIVFPVAYVLLVIFVVRHLGTNRIVVDIPRATLMSQMLLLTVYESFLDIDELAVLAKLEDVLHDDFAEDVYLGMVSTIAADEDPLLDIQDVNVQAFVAIEDLCSASTITADCEWSVEGIVQHWGHFHRRTLAMSGRFTFLQTAGKWKIQSLSRAEVAELTAGES